MIVTNLYGMLHYFDENQWKNDSIQTNLSLASFYTMKWHKLQHKMRQMTAYILA